MISSLDNKKVKEWTKLHQKKYRSSAYLLLNEELIKAAYKTKHLKTLIYCGEKPFDFPESYEVSREVLNKIAKTDNLDYLGIGSFVEERMTDGQRIIILEDLSDPLNIGRIMEAALLFGFNNVVLSKEAADIYHEKCLNASKGAIYYLNICHKDIENCIRELKEKNYRIYATGLSAQTKEMYELETREKMAFIMGKESCGVKAETFLLADEIVKIDMHNIDSLNVAMAAGIIMYRFSI